MARKRKKARQRQNPGKGSPEKSSRQALDASGFVPFFSHSPEPGVWRGFVPCLLLAFLARVWVGVSGEWIFRPDEIYQYAEQAHRLVFGYGMVPWEFSLGFRTWLLPAIPAVPMFVGKLLGLGHPDFYIPAVKIWNALLSLVIPAGMYLFGRRIMSEPAARLALLLGCFWHEFIIFSTHPLAEQYATIVFFSALALVPYVQSGAGLFAVGILFGLTVAFRIPYFPLVGAAGLFLLFLHPFARWRLVVAGGACAILAWGGVDYLTWGRWWHSPRLFAGLMVFGDATAGMELPRFHRLSQLTFLAENSSGLYAAALLAFFRWRRHWVLLAMAAAVLVIHLATINQEYTNVFVLLPVLWMLIAAVSQDAPHRFKGSAAWVAGAVALAVTLFVFSAGVPNPKTSSYSDIYGLTPSRKGILRSEILLKIARDFASIPPEKVRSIVWVPVQWFRDGGYYYAHHRVPMLFPNRTEDHKQLCESRPLNTLASHVVASPNQTLPGFYRLASYGRFALFANKTPETVRLPANLPTDFQTGLDLFFLRKARELKLDIKEPKRRVMLFEKRTDHPGGAAN